MNHLAPRQGKFAIVLLISFCLHFLMLTFSSEKSQYEQRTQKGEKIVEQLAKEAMVGITSQDRISLSVLANRYQVDQEVAKLVISDQNNKPLVQTGQAQNDGGQVIDKPIIQNNQVLGRATITMKAVSKGEIVSSQWLFVLGSAILHGFLWLIYGYMARPTQEQLAQLGEKVQQHIALARGSLAPTNPALTADGELQLDDHDLYTQAGDSSATAQPAATGKTINDFLNREKSKSVNDNNQAQPTATEATDNLAQENTVDSQKQPEIELQIHFYDQYHLLKRVAPEVAKPYFQLCNQLLMRASNSLFNSSNNVLNRYIKDVYIKDNSHFNANGAVVHLAGKAEQLPLAAVLLSKLLIILNQVVYEKHRELSRFALPLTIGTSISHQFDDVQKLMANHAKEDGLLLLYPLDLLKTLDGKVQFKNLQHPTTITEREMVWYNGLSETLMTELIAKRDEILTATEK
jgi:hypothetical protein